MGLTPLSTKLPTLAYLGSLSYCSRNMNYGMGSSSSCTLFLPYGQGFSMID